MLTEQRVIDLIFAELRRVGFKQPDRRSREMDAYRSAARQIVQDALIDQRAAARTASIAGSLITRGRTHL